MSPVPVILLRPLTIQGRLVAVSADCRWNRPGSRLWCGSQRAQGERGGAVGNSTCEREGAEEKRGARGSQGSVAADPQKLFILQSSCDVGCPRKGARPRAGDSSHLRPPLNKAHSYGLSAGSTPSCWINKSFLPKGKYRHPLHTTTTPNWQHRAQCQSPPP